MRDLKRFPLFRWHGRLARVLFPIGKNTRARRPCHEKKAIALLVLLIFTGIASAREFYLDPAGDDAADGSEKTPWKSLARVQSEKLQPGDTIRLHRGGTWHESLWVPASGSAEKPIVFTAYGDGELPIITGDNTRALAIECNQSNIVIESLHLTATASPERGAISIWVHQDFSNLTIRYCTITNSAGPAIWVAGEKDKQLKGIFIHHNTITDNAGSGILMAKGAGGEISHNLILRNCQKNLSPWQAGIRVWSADQFDLKITKNRVAEQRYKLTDGAGCGIHVDETGPGIEVTDNDIFDTDAAGILIENTRGVHIENNLIARTHTGIFIYRAGHDHVITHNTIVNPWELGIVLQGMVGNGVNMGPELLVDGQRITGNRVTNNIVLGAKYANLKCIEGAERVDGPTGNVYSENLLGDDRRGLIEWGKKELDHQADWERLTGQKLSHQPVEFQNAAKDNYRLRQSTGAGATR